MPDDFKGNKIASDYAWPSVLGKLRQIPVDNRGAGGASPKLVWHEILNYEFGPDDIVVILWPGVGRYHVLYEDGSRQRIAHWNDGPAERVYFDYIYEEYDYLLDLNLRMSHVTYHLEHIQVYHMLQDPIFLDCLQDWNQAKILDVFISEFRKNYPKGWDKNHPNEEFQFELATRIDRAITEKCFVRR